MNTQPAPIADEDLLYRRVHCQHLREDGTIAPTAFTPIPKTDREISVDLARLTTPDEALARSREPAKNGLAELRTAVPRECGLEVRHSPIPENHSHTDIVGDFTKLVRNHLAQAASLIRRPTMPNA